MDIKKMQEEDPFYDINTTISATERPGLTPAQPYEEDPEAYGELYAIHPPKDPK